MRPNLTAARGSSINGSGGRITLDNVTLRDALMYAYGIPFGREYQLQGPQWIDDAKFDISATFPPGAPRESVKKMLQNLLAMRFELTIRYETRRLGCYALVVAKRGPKLTLNSTAGEDDFTFGKDHLTARALTMANLADRLSSSIFKLDRPVIDQTGVKGAYNFMLQWAPDDVPPDANSGPSLFTALEEQLGLRLVAKTMPVRILILDHALKVPNPN